MQGALNMKILMPIVVPYMCVIEDRRRTILISERSNLVFGAKCIERCLRPCSRHISVQTESINTFLCLRVDNGTGYTLDRFLY